MTIRSKLNLAVASLIAVFLASAMFAKVAVSRNAESTQLSSCIRGLAQLASDIRTDIYHQLAVSSGVLVPGKEPIGKGWPGYVLEDIDIRIRLAESEEERGHWLRLRNAITALDFTTPKAASEAAVVGALRSAEHHLRSLRSLYALREIDAIADSASTGFRAEVAISVGCVLTVLLFLIYVILVRDWLVKPIEVLKQSADTLGMGGLGHRVPLQGNDELAHLGRRLDAMALRLAEDQRELLEARELSAIGELCTNVAHGLRNPLASLRASAQMAGRRAGDPEENRRAALEIIRQVDRLDGRITRLFEFSRPERVEARCTTFAELAQSAQAEVAAYLQEQEISLVIEDETERTVWCLDRLQMTAVLSELVANAAHHSRSGGRVVMRGSAVASVPEGARQLSVQVIDNGAGMAPATLEKAFDLFFTNRRNGAGMGLAMVRRAIERHGGRVDLTSELGRGTTATICVPGWCAAYAASEWSGEDVPDGTRCAGCQERSGPQAEWVAAPEES